jgi:hypothetical protein
VSVYPPAPRELETVRVRLPLGVLGSDVNGQPDTYDERSTTLTMANNKITVSLLMKGNDGFPRTPELDWPLGQLPPGSYEVEVVKRSPNHVNEGVVGTASFIVAPRASDRALFNYSDLYYDVAEPGWGLSVNQLPSGGLFLIWFAYESNGQPVWYFVSEGTWTYRAGLSFRGTVYRSTGGDFSGRYDASQFHPSPVGTAEISFFASDYNLGAFILTVNGKTFTKTVRRQQL